MRERLITSLMAAGVGCCQYAGSREAAEEALDVVLLTLREPDSQLVAAGVAGIANSYHHSCRPMFEPWDSEAPAAFTAMIDQVREGK